jgi:pyroglutamyl-peptidase
MRKANQENPIKTRILLTGFQKFQAYKVNCSEEVVKLFSNNPTEFGEHIEIATKILKVSWTESFPAMQEAIEKNQPNAILSFGVGTAEIELEKRALKVFSGKDVDGKLPPPFTDRDGANEYWTSFPDSILKEMKENIEQISEKLTCHIDHHCGCYLCNDLFYRTLHFLQKNKTDVPVLFIHLPQEKELKSCDNYLKSLEKVAKAIIITTTNYLKNCPLPAKNI